VSIGDSGEGSGIGFATARGRNWPTLRQFTVFLENRVGQLLEVVRRFDGSRVRIVALSISDSGECAFVRFLVSHPEQGREILERAGLAIIESDLIGVELPDHPQPLLQVCTALLQAEVNIIQAYDPCPPAGTTGGRPDGRQHRDGARDPRQTRLRDDHRGGSRRGRLRPATLLRRAAFRALVTRTCRREAPRPAARPLSGSNPRLRR